MAPASLAGDRRGFPMRLVIKVLGGALAGIALVVALAVAGAGWVRLSTREQTVAFKSGELTLQGTLLTPRWGSPSAAIVLVHGSGQTTRKSTLTYAWIFAARGYSALAYDKRGVGASEGAPDEWDRFSLDDLASDAAAAYRFLQARPEVDPKRIGFFAASQGVWVTSEAANRVGRPAFLIMASGSVSTVAEDRLYGRRAEIGRLGFDARAADHAERLLRLDHEVTRSGKGFAELEQALAAARTEPWYAPLYGDRPPLAVDDAHRTWERTVLDFDPRPRLKRLDVPTLWIFGDPALDRFSPVSLSLTRVRAAKRAGKPYEILQIDGVGHTLELDDAGAVETLIKVRLPLIVRIFGWLHRNAPSPDR